MVLYTEDIHDYNCLNMLCPFQKINEKPQVINDYEAGRAIPNNQIMNKLERSLGMCCLTHFQLFQERDKN